MKVPIQKWGNSLALRLPKALAHDARLVHGSEFDLRLEDGRVVLVPLKKRRPALEELLARVTPENTRSEADWGPAS
ncbi:MAG TPA: AbrB/MazE/SpoVT family DNA-binding domain-containing protein [Opitutaceae bacterium]|nr:AbrB/MazE/SpoVT family DNA-binding domain-containing protein [Opitutaceae bacterium]